MLLSKRSVFGLAGMALSPWPPASAASEDVYAGIRRQAVEASQIMRIARVLTDVYGARLTGSPQTAAASAWAAARMRSWGFASAHLDPWDFGHDGWTNERASAYIFSPARARLQFEVAAWTPGTNGAVRGRPTIIDPPRRTRDEVAQYLSSVRAEVRNRIVLVGEGVAAPPTDPVMHRLDDETMARFLNPDWRPPQTGNAEDALSLEQFDQTVDEFLMTSGALVRVNDSGRRYGLVTAPRNRRYDIRRAPPTITLRNEDYGRIARLMEDDVPVTLEIAIENRSHPSGRTSYNVIGEISGSDKREEIVMLGAHLDSWHSAAGATDNAIGCAIILEAMRILLALDVRPRRTIRVALWSGEEQGLLGSQHYVAQHFGTAENPGPEFANLSAYINLDSGTGRVRGMNVFGPADSAAVLRQILRPFADIGVAGAVHHGVRKLRGTDATTFSRAGLPAIGVIQDPIEYGSLTWHSNADFYERIVEADAKHAAVAIAAVTHDLAMREEMMPRFAPGEMPPAEGPAPALRPARGHGR